MSMLWVSRKKQRIHQAWNGISVCKTFSRCEILSVGNPKSFSVYILDLSRQTNKNKFHCRCIKKKQAMK